MSTFNFALLFLLRTQIVLTASFKQTAVESKGNFSIPLYYCLLLNLPCCSFRLERIKVLASTGLNVLGFTPSDLIPTPDLRTELSTTTGSWAPAAAKDALRVAAVL